MPEFLITTCQVGAERALKSELARRWPELRLAYSRPGLVTFRLPDAHPLLQGADLESVFARAWCRSLGKIEAAEETARLAGVLELAAGRPIARLHVWQRDTARPEFRGFEPGPTETSRAFEASLREFWSTETGNYGPVPPVVTWATAGELVLDVVLDETERVLVGIHTAGEQHIPWPGGLAEQPVPPHAVSRAYAKVDQALVLSGMPIVAGDRCAELGCSPGGASQALLERGLHVLGVDPGEMHPDVLAHPNFTHLRKRSIQARQREYWNVPWLFSDMNVAPNYTLDAAEGIIEREHSHVRGVLLILKLMEWKLAEQIPTYLERIASWGMNHIWARQLQTHRQEFCVCAWRDGTSH